MKSSKHFFYPRSRVLKVRELKRVYRTLLKAQGPQHWWPAETPFEMMVGAILTQNTAWKNVERAIGNLKKARKLNPRALLKIGEGKLADLIRPAGYFNIKADRLKHFVRFLDEEFEGKPRRMTKKSSSVLRRMLLQVKGIGPETADSILLYGAGKHRFVIDAYTKRVFARHRLHPLDAPYDAWQLIFEANLPRDLALYNDFHAQIVNLGKNYCRTKPRCESCPLRHYL